MYAIEFQATVANGIIHIPAEYRKKFRHRVKVILLAEETTGANRNLIDQLFAKPLQLDNFDPLTREEVYAR